MKLTRMLFTPSLLQLVLDSVPHETIGERMKTIRILWLCGEVRFYTKTPFWGRHFILKMVSVLRHARDKHRANSKEERRFPQVVSVPMAQLFCKICPVREQ
jgi:hypothetical protein